MARKHSYETCRDKDCPQFGCRVWKDAIAEGYAAGFADGVQAALVAARANR